MKLKHVLRKKAKLVFRKLAKLAQAGIILYIVKGLKIAF